MADPIKSMTDWDHHKAMLDKKADETGTKIDEAGLLAHLRSRIKGQDAILEDVAKLIRLQAAKKQKDKPMANLLFLGPTGTRKTELAKAITSIYLKIRTRCCVSMVKNCTGQRQKRG
jgi:ATP-dependent Clp protease ATP-binding subunit ClpA